MSAHQELEDWRQTFCRRIRAAADRLCSNVPLNTTVRAHCREFKRLLADNAWFLDQTIQLSRFEFQVVSIASTKKELEGDLRFFSAAEVRRALERRPDDETRLQVQELIYNSQDDREKTIVVRAYESTSEEPRPSLFANDQPRLAPIDDVRRDDAQWLDVLGLPQRASKGTKVLSYCPRECCDAMNFLCIVRAAGGAVPKAFGRPAWAWGEAGEAVQVQVPVPDVLQTTERWTRAVEKLLEARWLLTYNTEGALVVNPARKPHSAEPEDVWKWAALAAVCRAFPRWPNPRSASAATCKILMPLLATVLSYLPHLPGIQGPLRRSVAEVCLSASYFGLLPWKESMLATAETYCHQDLTSDDYLVLQLRLRARMLKRLHPHPDTNQVCEARQRPSQYLNALSGQEIVFEAKQLLDNDSPLFVIESHLLKFRPGGSTLEKSIAIESKTVMARAYRNRGYFTEAHRRYTEILAEARKVPSDLTNDLIASHAETLCELRQPEKAISVLNEETGFHLPARTSRLHLALAYAHLTKGLLDGSMSLSVNEAYCVFTQYVDQLTSHPAPDLTTTMKRNLYIALAGKAMAYHLLFVEGLLPKCDQDQLDEAKANWHTAKKAAQACWPQPGFAEMISLYSLCDLHQCDGTSEIYLCRQEAECLWKKTGIQYHFVLQGTIWFAKLRSRGSFDTNPRRS